MVILAKEYTLVLRLGLDLTLKHGLCDSYPRIPIGLARNSVCWPNFVFRHSPWFPLAVGCTGSLRVERGLEAYFEMSSILVLGIV
ncbi:hypothetical protein L6452_03457 [Arctium lappa]|uniref:Uncharacterized protein n=1 Tax=Arctium lappa TaxID=4217 RepID=A0ACB9FM86_ARCLA|nr:hypothetical protein L6452_03457 [Arctium lappa]